MVLTLFPQDPGKTVEGPVMAHLVMIDEAVKEFPPLKFYSSKGFVTKYHNIHELATVTERYFLIEMHCIVTPI